MPRPTVLPVPPPPSAPPSAILLKQLLQSRLAACAPDASDAVASERKLSQSISVSSLVSLAGVAATIQLMLADRRRRTLRMLTGAAAVIAWAVSHWLARSRRAIQDAVSMRSTLHSEAATLLAHLEKQRITPLPLPNHTIATQTDPWSPPPQIQAAPMPPPPCIPAPPPIPLAGAMAPPPPPPPPPPMLSRRPPGGVGMPSAADLMTALSGLKQRSVGDESSEDAGKKDASTLAGARSMGISLDALLSVKLKAASSVPAECDDQKPAASTPEVIKARSASSILSVRRRHSVLPRQTVVMPRRAARFRRRQI